MDHNRAYRELVALLRLWCCPCPAVGVSCGKETAQKQQGSNGEVIKIDKQTFSHLRVTSLTHFILPIHCPVLVRQDPWSVRLESVEIEICVYYTQQLEQTDKVQANSNKACNLI